MAGLWASAAASEAVAFNSAKAAEVAKLGDAANARVDAVTGWLKAMGGNHFGALAKVLQLAPVAETVVGLEHLMHRYVSQGGGSFSGAHREPSFYLKRFTIPILIARSWITPQNFLKIDDSR